MNSSNNSDNRKPKYILLNYDYKPLPRIRISEDYKNWTVVEDPIKCLELLEGKTEDYQRYLGLYKDYLKEGGGQVPR